MDCDEFSGLAAELALGVLTGRERADALAHLEHCDACRETVRRLAVTGEGLLELLPAAEPPPGFESRVMARIGIAPPARHPPVPGRAFPRRPRRLVAVAAVTLAVLAAGLGGWGLRAATAPASSPLSSAALVSAGHQAAGQVYYHAGGSRWLYMRVDLGSASTVVTCQLRGADGRFATLGTFRLDGGYGYWASPVPEASGQVTGVRVVSPDGTVLAAARFPG